jgi:predicted CoA-binding protein
MPAQQTFLQSIEDFLAQKRIAMVGVSRETPSISASLFKELFRRGCDVVPVNPNVLLACKTSNRLWMRLC